jgi:mannose/fructose/N-acetylgalactosamine-specific phosphotransferase system component IIC
MVSTFIFGLVSLVLVVGFLLVPIVKLPEPSLIVVVLIGVVMAVYEFIEELRKKD